MNRPPPIRRFKYYILPPIPPAFDKADPSMIVRNPIVSRSSIGKIDL